MAQRGIVGLLRLLREHEDAVEADLSQYHHIDYRDRWRFDEAGTRRLTLRRIVVLLRHLPADSATMRALGRPGLRFEHYLLADLFTAMTGRPHPAILKPEPVVDPKREKKLRDATERMRARRDALNAGQIT